MGENSAISWTDHTFNPWMGCTKVSPACDGCYAEALMDKRYGKVAWGAGEDRRRTSAANWREPIRWNRQAAETGTRPFVFCASLADVFDNEVDPTWRRDLFDLIDATPNLVWLLLTKRVGNVIRMVSGLGRPLPSNAAIGATMANDEEYGRDRMKLAAVKRALAPLFTFGSFEPLLGPVTLDDDAPDWIITGGETDQGGHQARPSHPDWFRRLRDQSRDLGRVYHHKQNGEWAPGECASGPPSRTEQIATLFDGTWSFGAITPRESAETHVDDEPDVYRLGKARAGRLLDGRTWDGRPALDETREGADVR